MDGSEVRPADRIGRQARLQQADAVAVSLQDRIIQRHAAERTAQWRLWLGEGDDARHIGGNDAYADNAALQQDIPTRYCHDGSPQVKSLLQV